MKILQVGKFYYPNLGGIETVLRNLSEGLVERGHEVDVLCFSSDFSNHTEVIQGVRIRRASTLAKIASQPLSSSFAQKLLQMAKGADLVQFHTPNPIAELVSLLLPRELPKVVAYHSDVVRQKWLLPFYLPLQRQFLNKMDRITVATENHIQHSGVLRNFAAKCDIIPYGLESKNFTKTDTVLRRAKEIRKEHGPYVLFVGRLVGYKGISDLIRAMPELRAKLLIIGEGPLEDELQKLSRSLGISEQIKFLGRIEDLGPYYLGAEVFVLPSISKNEAFGIVQLEAMAWGKPTVFTALDSGIKLVNVDQVTGFEVPPQEPPALAKAMQKLIENPELGKSMGIAAEARFFEFFTREKMVAAYEKTYRDLCVVKKSSS